MIKTPVTFIDYNGVNRTENYYFNFTKLELMEMEIHHEGGLSNYIKTLTETTAGPEAYDLFKELMLKAYGRKSEDGVQFIKEDPETGRPLHKEFEQSPAIGELIFSFIEDGNKAAAWVRGLMPREAIAAVEREAAEREAAGKTSESSEPSTDDTPVAPASTLEEASEKEKTWRDYTKDELLGMEWSEFHKVAGGDTPQHWSRTGGSDLLVIAMERRSKQ